MYFLLRHCNRHARYKAVKKTNIFSMKLFVQKSRIGKFVIFHALLDM